MLFYFKSGKCFLVARLCRTRQTKSAMKRLRDRQKKSVSFSSVSVSTKGTFTIIFIITIHPRTVYGGFITSLVLVLRCDGFLTGCAILLTAPIHDTKLIVNRTIVPQGHTPFFVASKVIRYKALKMVVLLGNMFI